jgi:hypothetical protein
MLDLAPDASPDAPVPDTIPWPDTTPWPDAMPWPDTLSPDITPLCDPTQCALDCHPTENRCNRVMPSNFDPTPFYDSVTADFQADALVSINTDTGAITSGGTIVRPAGTGVDASGIHFSTISQGAGLPEIGVFGVRSFSVTGPASVFVKGSNAFALYATDSISIAGDVMARATDRLPGPGGSAGGAADGAPGECYHSGGEGKGGAEAGAGGDQIEAGGGGGGRGASGGAGGDAFYGLQYASGGAGGPGNGVPELTPLFGGCGGGAGGGPDTFHDPDGHGGYGGGGGGAVQLVADGPIFITGLVNVGGAGGEGGHYGAGGGGGGSGGALLLQGTEIEVPAGAMVAANGGGGGAGSGSAGSATADNGDDAYPSVFTASGGSASGYGGNGGAGGAIGARVGEDGGAAGNGGGGGGAVGRIRLEANNITAGALNVSPSPSTQSSVTVW